VFDSFFLSPGIAIFLRAHNNAGEFTRASANQMRRQSNISEAERQRRAWQRAMSLHHFCERYDIGRTKAYEEINAGRLKARKAGRRTLITADDAEDWLSHLPALQEALDEAAS
jgi:hypothetical protein